MSGFTDFERAVLDLVCDEQATVAAQLREFMTTAAVYDRDNTGHGFYTSFKVDRTKPLIDWPLRLIDGPNAEVSVGGKRLLMGFILWLEDGYPHCLEGFQYCTPTGGNIDLKATGLHDIAWVGPMS